MASAGSAQHARPATAFLTVVAVIGALLTGFVALAPAASAATVYVGPYFGDVASVGGIGAPDGNPYTPSNCGAGAALTSIGIDIDDRGALGSWLQGVEPSCTPLLGGLSVHLGTESAIAPLQGFHSIDATASTSCAPGTVAVGLQGNGGTLTNTVQLICQGVNPDGTLDGVDQPSTEVGPSGGAPAGPFTCKPNSVLTGVSGELGEDITSLTGLCSTMTFTSGEQLPDNTSWPHARLVSGSSTTSGQQLETAGEQLWYAFPVQPNSKVNVTLSGLSNDLDLAVFKDINQSFTQLTSTQDLTHLSAEFAGDAYAPSVFSPSVFSPSVFSPSVFSPSVFSPSVFSPSVFSPSVFSPSVFSPSVFSPAVSLPSVFSPSVFSGGAPDQSTLSNAFSSAQVRSLVGVSANPGTADESVDAETWNNTGNYYVRVSGRNGATSPFNLTVTTDGGPCGTPLADHAGDATLHGSAGPSTVILTDPNRVTGTSAAKAALATAVGKFAMQVAVDGVDGAVVNLDNSPKVQALDAQADSNPGCPYAKNLVAQSIRDIVNSYRGPALKYVVIVGGDSVIPFFRYADTAGLGPENNYYPPVADNSASQASLRTNSILSQDAYGAAVDISLKGTTLPIPDLAVGRLIETPAEMTATLTRYASTPVIHPHSTLATGYDFLADSAKSVAADFAAGNPATGNDTLITDQGVAPTVTTQNGTPDESHSWTASDLSNALLGRRHDVTFLAGHFSANSALAADYSTSLLTTDLAASTTDFSNSLVFSAGCHSGYNLVDQDGVPGVTLGLDWAQAFVQKGATLVAGTGYQYGDTDFVAYSEKLYAQFAHDLRVGTGAVAVGSALVQAKQDYLATLTSVAGIDQKSLLEATVYGLPMQGVDFTGRVAGPTLPGSLGLTPADADPGRALGLQSALLDVTPPLTARTAALTSTSSTVTASYLTGPDGVVTSPGAPTLPLASHDVSAPGQVLRGVGLRTADYSDATGITPLSGAATTEQSAAHVPFTSSGFYPNRLATPNYFDALAGGKTLLNITPAQYRSDNGALTDTQRTYSALGFQLFYSSNTTTYGQNTPALAAPPSISGVTASVLGSSIQVSTHVVGDPSAGVQQVWVTYTGEHGSSLHGKWRSVDLTQDSADSTLWTGTIPVPDGNVDDVRFLVQAVNGVGEVGIDDNVGVYYSTGVSPGVPPATTATHIALDSSIPTHGVNGTSINVGATLTDDTGNPVSGAVLTFSLGTSGVAATTNSNGHATTPMQLTGAGSYSLTASYAGDATRSPSSSTALPIAVDRQPTSLSLTRASDGSFVARLTDATGQPLAGQTVMLVSAGPSSVLAATPGTTRGDGSVAFAAASAPTGTRTLTAYFGDANTPVPGGTSDQQSPTFASSHSLSLRPGLVSLSDSTNGTSRFGTRVNFALSLGTQSASSTAPTGSVRFTVDGTLVATVALTTGAAPSVATTALLPGSHTVAATYSGDGSFLPATASVTHTVTCTTTYTGTVKSGLTITGSGKAICILNATVGGPVYAGPGVALAVVGSTVPKSGITAQSSGQVMVCSSRVGGSVVVQSAAALVVVGDPGHSRCPSNTLSGSLVLQSDRNGVMAIGNTVPNVVTQNIGGPGPYPGDVTTVSGNHR